MPATPASSDKPILAIDIDDTLVTSEAALRANHNQKFPQISVLSSFYSQDFTRHGNAANDIEAEIRRFFDSDEFYQLLPLEGAAEAVDRLAQRYELILVTARPKYTLSRTMQWINQHFPNRFQDAVFVGTDEHQKIDLQRSKNPILHKMGVEVLIDDNLKHSIEAAESGIRTILFGEYGWNQSDALPAGVQRAADWRAVEDILL